MALKYDNYKGGCGLVETEQYVLFECTLYEEDGEVVVRGLDEYEIIKG